MTPVSVGALADLEIPVTEAIPQRLEDFARAVENTSQAEGLAVLRQWLAEDLAAVEDLLTELNQDRAAGVAEPLLAAGGKRIRPLCLLAASRLGDKEPSQHAVGLATVVEYIHNATLLHDDVVDLAVERRGKPTARMIHGNTVAVFAGDWLLVRALRLIHQTGSPWALPAALDCIDELIEAEILQIELSQSGKESSADYLRVIDGKTASLFRLAFTYAGYLAGLDTEQREQLTSFATHLGVAFQIQDDLLDLIGDPKQTGKPLFGDLAEGKLTLPILWLLHREPRHRSTIQALTHCAPEKMDIERVQQLRKVLSSSGAIDASREMIEDRLREAHSNLDRLPKTVARSALRLMTQLLVGRTS